MYEAFYGLSSKPFQLSPDPNFYFGSKQHRRAKAYLDYGVLRNDGFIVITGEIGAGKTTLLRGLLDSLNRSNVVIGNLVTTQLDAEDTLRMVGSAFGVRVKDLPKSEVLMTLEAFFVSQTSQGKRCLLIVDEAQNLTARAVEELRMLSNFQFSNQSLLQTFLVGQPEFRGILQRPEMEQFRQRVAATCHIGPLDEDETQRYIEHRLKCAGSTGKPTFAADAFPAIFKASQGIPRRINSLCDRLLLLGFMGSKTHLALSDVEEALRDIAQEIEVPKAVQGEGVDALAALQDGSRYDLSRLNLGADDVAALSSEFEKLGDGQQADRLQRLEASLLRLERINLQTLQLMQRLLSSVKQD
ncbi:XrtA/PEP-CTERM system-associated ATPase [Paucibacter sp. Y2R2-4]|uniref:XrtA/PEP-CTERM system-associated ATPase n=1 Tax=Paucibacter sp. Y2R2-4 TaxID=2893553 RepID=UPI0021E4DD92|nr:XrtA/PEP-CTERM system-associated ATPase [Paucibacter sp. Y2R2-4]MCV2348576.1 XrtA-associated ATPase [Paucibacter sp. Y2R2-4]